MGSLFAARLADVADVVMVGSWTEQLQIVNQTGIGVRQLDGSESRHTIVATSLASQAYPVEVALILVKSWQTAAAAARAREAMSSDGVAITLQNGLGNLRVLSDAVGVNRAVQGITSEGATLLGPGMVRHAGQGHTHLAYSEPTLEQVERVATLLNEAGLSTSVVDDAKGLIWGKLAVNAAINPLTALLQVPNGWLLRDNRITDIMTDAAREAALVAAGLGIQLPFEDAADQAISVATATGVNRSSMAQDIARGMPTEIEQITGAVVRNGQRLNIQTPVNDALLQLVRVQIAAGSWHDAIVKLPAGVRERFRYISTLETEDGSSR
jgi:2-dehydropantoate 2-reductase